MKNLIYVLIIFLAITACEKNDADRQLRDQSSRRELTGPEATLRSNLDLAAEILAGAIQDDAVLNEMTLLSDESRTFYSLPFRDLLDQSKGQDGMFKNLRDAFLSGCSSAGSKGGWNDLAEFLAGNDCYIYCPYPSNFYPKRTGSFTVAGHPIDNDFESTGYRFEGKKMITVTVNEDYADKYPVILIMPRDEDNDDLKELAAPNTGTLKGDPVYEVRIGKVRCADYCGGLFEGELELRIARGFPDYNMTTGGITGKMSTVIPVRYPRSYAKAAIREYTVHSEAGWLLVNMPWDTNWRVEKIQQCILAYEYDSVKETSINATVAYKADDLSSALTTTFKISYSGDFLGLVEWDRDWFYRTNTTPGYYDEVKDGWVVRKTCPDFKLTTPSRTIY